MQRRFTALHKGLYKDDHGFGNEVALLALADWVVVVKCKHHSTSNAIKRGAHHHTESLDNKKDPHIAIAACRNGASQLYDGVMDYVNSHLGFTDICTGSIEEREALWRAMDVKLTFTDHLVALDLNWDGSRLWANCQFKNDTGIRELSVSVLTYMMKWRDYSETRWGCACSSGRLFLRGLLAGLDGLYALVEEMTNLQDLSGFERAIPAVRNFFVVVAFGGYPAESAGMELFEDDAWLLRADELRETMTSEMQYVQDLG